MHDFLYGAALHGAQDALAIPGGERLRQFDLDFEDLVVAVFGIDDVVMRHANIMRGDIACHTIHFGKIGRAQCRGSEEIVEGSGGRAIAFVTDGLISDNRKVIKAGLYPQVVEKLNVYFHELNPILGGGMTWSPTPVKRWRILFHTTRRSGANN